MCDPVTYYEWGCLLSLEETIASFSKQKKKGTPQSYGRRKPAAQALCTLGSTNMYGRRGRAPSRSGNRGDPVPEGAELRPPANSIPIFRVAFSPLLSRSDADQGVFHVAWRRHARVGPVTSADDDIVAICSYIMSLCALFTFLEFSKAFCGKGGHYKEDLLQT